MSKTRAELGADQLEKDLENFKKVFHNFVMKHGTTPEKEEEAWEVRGEIIKNAEAVIKKTRILAKNNRLKENV